MYILSLKVTGLQSKLYLLEEQKKIYVYSEAKNNTTEKCNNLLL